jgi:hypothetical protein
MPTSIAVVCPPRPFVYLVGVVVSVILVPRKHLGISLSTGRYSRKQRPTLNLSSGTFWCSYGEAIEEDVGASEEDEVHYGFFTLPVVWPVDCSYSLDE